MMLRSQVRRSLDGHGEGGIAEVPAGGFEGGGAEGGEGVALVALGLDLGAVGIEVEDVA